MTIRVSISLCFWWASIYDIHRLTEIKERKIGPRFIFVARTDNNGTDSPITYYGSSCYAKLGVARPEVVLDRGE